MKHSTLFKISFLALGIFSKTAAVCTDCALPGNPTQICIQSTAQAQPVLSPVAKALEGYLVSINQGGFQDYSLGVQPSYDYYLFYFSAHWCPPCQAFTPQLVKFYNQLSIQDKKRVLVVFVSNDNSLHEMLAYMVQTQMPWPAINYKKITALPSAIKHLAGPGIPDLVLVDPFFQVLANSYINGKYVGPQNALNQTSALLSAPQIPNPATTKATVSAVTNTVQPS